MSGRLEVTNPRLHNAIVEFALNWFENNDADSERLIQALAERFPDAKGRDVHVAILDVGQRFDEQAAFSNAVWDAEADFNAKCLALFDGLPEDTKLVEAARIKAEQGDEFARYLLNNPHLLGREIEIGGDE